MKPSFDLQRSSSQVIFASILPSSSPFKFDFRSFVFVTCGFSLVWYAGLALSSGEGVFSSRATSGSAVSCHSFSETSWCPPPVLVVISHASSCSFMCGVLLALNLCCVVQISRCLRLFEAIVLTFRLSFSDASSFYI